MGGEEKALYKPPEKYDLPEGIIKPSFWNQSANQVKRAMIVVWRDRLTRTISSTIIVGSVIFITILDGVSKVANDSDPQLPFDMLVRPLESEQPSILTQLFVYSESQQIQ